MGKFYIYVECFFFFIFVFYLTKPVLVYKRLLCHAEHANEAGLEHHALWLYLLEVHNYLFCLGKHSVKKNERVRNSLTLPLMIDFYYVFESCSYLVF